MDVENGSDALQDWLVELKLSATTTSSLQIILQNMGATHPEHLLDLEEKDTESLGLKVLETKRWNKAILALQQKQQNPTFDHLVHGYPVCVATEVSSNDNPQAAAEVVVVAPHQKKKQSMAAMDSQAKNFNLRPYQEYLCKEAKDKNTIVLLPTGAGKTLVGAEIIREKLNSKAKGLIIFLVPTCLLVEQQGSEIRNWLGNEASVGEFSGNIKSFPDLACTNVLVCTPESFRVKQRYHPEFLGWNNISLLIFDEVHHVLKDHPYRKIALSLNLFKLQQKSSSHHNIIINQHKTQVLGLTALLTYSVSPEKVKKAQEKLCDELDIDVMPYVSKTQLQNDGFHAGSGTKTEIEDQIEIPDIFEIEKIVLEKDRLPHLMYQTFWDRYKNGKITSFGKEIVKIIHLIEKYILENPKYKNKLLPKFESQLSKIKLSEWGVYANKQGKKCNKIWNQIYLFLEHWYEALRIVISNWEEPKGIELSILFLKMMENKTNMNLINLPKELFDLDIKLGRNLSNEINQFFEKYDIFPHLTHISHQLLRKKLEKQMNPEHEELRALIFVQQKTTAHILTYHLNNDIDIINSQLQATPLHSTTTTSPSASISFSKSMAKKSLDEFSLGIKNILVTTTVAEEGMDISKSNCVIRFDPIQTGVSFVQGRGRARQENSSHIITSQRNDRPIEIFENVENIQAKLSSNYVPSKSKDITNTMMNEEIKAQKNRENNAYTFLKENKSKLTIITAIGILAGFVSKTKADLEEFIGNGCYILIYSSCIRKIQIQIKSLNLKTNKEKKIIKQQATMQLIMKLLEEENKL